MSFQHTPRPWMAVGFEIVCAGATERVQEQLRRGGATTPEGIVRAARNPDGSMALSIFLSPLDVHVNRSPVDGKLEESLDRVAEAIAWQAGAGAGRAKSVAAMMKASVAPSVSEVTSPRAL